MHLAITEGLIKVLDIDELNSTIEKWIHHFC